MTEPGTHASPRWRIAALVCVLAAVAVVMVPRLTDVEVFMRMALGRLAFDGVQPHYESLLFTEPARFANPEWLGDEPKELRDLMPA